MCWTFSVTLLLTDWESDYLDVSGCLLTQQKPGVASGRRRAAGIKLLGKLREAADYFMPYLVLVLCSASLFGKSYASMIQRNHFQRHVEEAAHSRPSPSARAPAPPPPPARCWVSLDGISPVRFGSPSIPFRCVGLFCAVVTSLLAAQFFKSKRPRPSRPRPRPSIAPTRVRARCSRASRFKLKPARRMIFLRR
jgi:hypothetical protein